MQIYHALENPAFDKLLLHVRGRNGAISVQMEDTLRRVLRYQRAQQPIVIGYIADQVPMWDSIHLWLPFLHHETPVLTGAERIIRRADQVPFYGAISRVRRGHYRCELQLMTDQPQAPGARADQAILPLPRGQYTGLTRALPLESQPLEAHALGV